MPVKKFLPNDLERARREVLLNALGRRDVHADHHNCGQSNNVRVLKRDRSEQCMYGYSTAQASCAAYHWPQERSWPPEPAMESDPMRWSRTCDHMVPLPRSLSAGTGCRPHGSPGFRTGRASRERPSQQSPATSSRSPLATHETLQVLVRRILRTGPDSGSGSWDVND